MQILLLFLNLKNLQLNIFPGHACNEKYIFVTTCQYFFCVIATATK